MRKITFIWVLATALAMTLFHPLRADQITMQNGDVLNGSVLGVSTNAILLKNENLGLVSLSRAKVTAIRFGPVNGSPAAAAPNSSQPADLTSALRGIRDQTNLIQQVQSQILGASASPEANAKFDELLDGLSTGKLDINDLRQQAGAAADQIKELKKELGPDDSGELDSYLAILNSFLEESSPSASTSTNQTAAPAKILPSGQRSP